MTRFALTANQDAASLPHVPYVLLAEFDFPSDFVRVNSADRYYTHNAQQFGPLGTLCSIGPVKENGDLIPEKLEFQLSGVDNSLITKVRTELYHGRDSRLWVGYVNAESYQLVATPHLLWEGYMDTMSILTEENSSLISLVCENRLIRWNLAADHCTYTHESQRLFDATDKFFNKVATLGNKVAKWRGELVITGGGTGARSNPKRGRTQEV